MININMNQLEGFQERPPETLPNQKMEAGSSPEAPSAQAGKRRKRLLKAFSIIELLCVIAMIAIILSSAVPAYMNQLNKARIARAKAEIKIIAESIEDYLINRGEYPNNLHDVGYGYRTDPWGNLYQYLRIDGGEPGEVGKKRKVYSQKPLNSDYDLYSMGRDGHSAPPLTAGPSQDDVLRLDDGGYLGVGSVYQQQAKEELGGGGGAGKAKK